MKTAKQAAKTALLLLIVFAFLFPVLCMVARTFSALSLTRYPKVPGESFGYWRGLLNSLIITVPTVLGQVILSALAAFSLAKLKLPLRNTLLGLYLILLILPLQVTLVPTYMVLDRLSLLNRFPAVILPGAYSAFGVCLLRQNMKYVSNSTIEAAKMDGASYFTVFGRIVVPQIKGPLAALTVLCFIDSWNAVEQPLIYLNDRSMYPLSVTLSEMGSTGDAGPFLDGILFMVPPLLVYLLAYREQDIAPLFKG